jgi:hypothetical protein
MAFNFSVFKVRALSAIVFVLIMLAGLLINSWSYFALFLLIQIGDKFSTNRYYFTSSNTSEITTSLSRNWFKMDWLESDASCIGIDVGGRCIHKKSGH